MTLGGGDRLQAAFALAGSVACVGIEVTLDRADLAPSALVPSTLAVGGLLTAAVAALHRQSGRAVPPPVTVSSALPGRDHLFGDIRRLQVAS
jgi:hypothetical protein